MVPSRLESLIRELIAELVEAPARQGLVDTPRRVADWLELFSVRCPAPIVRAAPANPPDKGRMIVVQNLGFRSLCEHHLLPFFGRVHIGCITRERRCDAELCEEVVAYFAHRPQLQERFTEQIADFLFEALAPEGLGVAAEGRHMCMMMRGVEKQNSEIQSSSLRGCFLEPAIRRTFFRGVASAASMGK